MEWILQTERLRLRRFTLQDTAFIITLVNTPGWLQFIGDRNIKTDQQAQAYLENGPLKSYRENGFGLSMVERKDSTPVGMCGILKRGDLEIPDIGFAFLPAFIGKGYAVEIAAATLQHAHTVLEIKNISAITVPANERSISLLEKLGFIFDKTFKFTGSEEELRLYTHTLK